MKDTPTILSALMMLWIPGGLAHAALPAALAAAMDQAPINSQILIVIPDMARLSDKIAALQQNLDLPTQDLEDVLVRFKRRAGMTEGVNDHGAMVFAITDLEETLATKQSPRITMLVPVSDYNTFVKQYGGNSDNEICAVTMPQGQSGFARRSGDHAVLCQSREETAAYEAGNAASTIAQQAGALGNKYLSSGDLIVYADIPKLKAAVATALQQAADQANAAATPETVDAQQLTDSFVNEMEVFVEGLEALVGSLDLSDTGVGLTCALQYKADAILASMLPGGTADTVGLLATLPDEPYVVASSLDLNAINMAAMLKRILSQIPAGQPDMFSAVAKDVMPLIEQVNGIASVFYAPDPNNMMMMMMGGFNSLSVYQVDDTGAFLDQTKQLFENIDQRSNQIDDNAAPALEPDALPPYTVRYMENAMQIDGVRVDQYELNINLPAEAMPGPVAPLMMAARSHQGYIAAKGKYVIQTSHIDPQMITKALAAVDQGTGIGATGPIHNVRNTAMPPNPVMESYLSISGIAQMANGFLPLIGMPLIVVPDGLPPLCAAAGIQDHGAAIRFYLPMQSLQMISNTVTNIQQQQQGGGQAPIPNGPGGAPPPPFN